ncbi:MAG: hypothetical protein KKF46_00155 [Nanoarchaeota archaeon]|nr:hypothetical protein [Nanoarchaeota archaeon]MBU1320745.1 hypothetical protein [Nanoarchaeota archaeon]MBU1597141.1 hypothetical protein [Nanoarchaeota archaeon]MBU2442076.1 hypothetical protein [Nanoarchaeota archaeon]
MNKITKIELIFGFFALAIILVVLTNNASITGFVVGTDSDIRLLSPGRDITTVLDNIYFIFEYSEDLIMTECTLIVNNDPAKSTKTLLSPYDTRIRRNFEPGTYEWRIECTDTSDVKWVSETRKLTIQGEETPAFVKSQFPNKPGFIYEFEIKENTELTLKELAPNDLIKVTKQNNVYEINILRLNQDYTKGIDFMEVLVVPGNKRLKIDEGVSTEIDFNNDGEIDLIFTLEDVTYRKATVGIKTQKTLPADALRSKASGATETESPLAVKKPEIEKPTIIITPKQDKMPAIEKQEPAQVQQLEKKGFGSLQIFAILVGVVILVIVIAVYRNKSKEEEAKYIQTLKTIAKKKKPKKREKTQKKAKKKKVQKKSKKKK